MKIESSAAESTKPSGLLPGSLPKVVPKWLIVANFWREAFPEFVRNQLLPPFLTVRGGKQRVIMKDNKIIGPDFTALFDWVLSICAPDSNATYPSPKIRPCIIGWKQANGTSEKADQKSPKYLPSPFFRHHFPEGLFQASSLASFPGGWLDFIEEKMIQHIPQLWEDWINNHFDYIHSPKNVDLKFEKTILRLMDRCLIRLHLRQRPNLNLTFKVSKRLSKKFKPLLKLPIKKSPLKVFTFLILNQKFPRKRMYLNI
jgi:hypothetical protein